MSHHQQGIQPAEAPVLAPTTSPGTPTNGHRARWTLVEGVVAGVAAVAALVAVRNLLWKVEPQSVREREMRLREGAEQTGLQKPVRAVADRLSLPLDKKNEVRVAKGVAWLLGVAGVVGYAFARRRFRRARLGAGLAFGAAVWALEDETLWPLLGIAKGPRAYPWWAHARGLGAHLAYGAAAEATLRGLDRLRPSAAAVYSR